MIHNNKEVQDEKGSLKGLGDNDKAPQKPEHASMPTGLQGESGSAKEEIGQSHNSHNSPVGKFEWRNARYGP